MCIKVLRSCKEALSCRKHVTTRDDASVNEGVANLMYSSHGSTIQSSYHSVLGSVDEVFSLICFLGQPTLGA